MYNIQWENHKFNKDTLIPSSLPWNPNKQRKQHNVRNPSFICSSHVILSSPYDVAPIAYNAHNWKEKFYDGMMLLRVLEEWFQAQWMLRDDKCWRF